MSDFRVQLDYYLQAFRLHQGLSKAVNDDTISNLSIAISAENNFGQDLPRSYGLLSFTIQTSWLCDWIEHDEAVALLSRANSDLAALNTSAGNALAGVTSKSSVDDIARAVILAYARIAVELDGSDYDNHWSLGTANLYAGNFAGGFSEYDEAISSATDAPQVVRSSIDVDYADALFFAGKKNLSNNAEDYRSAILKAKDKAKEAIASNPKDSKRHRWNWTLGWAYYELAAYDSPDKNYALSLATLLLLKNPHKLIMKNIIASAVGCEMTGLARKVAQELLKIDPGYTVAIEDRWPYRDYTRRERFKNHLRAADLPG